MVFYDLNISTEVDFQTKKELLDQLGILGFRGMAWNKVVEGNDIQKTPAPDTFSPNEKNLKQYSRLTMILQDSSQLHSLTSRNLTLSNYGILAIQPCDEKLFHTCCTSLEVDIICFDFGRRMEFPLKLPAVKSAMKRGIHFEISIGVALRDSAARKHLISNSLELMRITRGKNIIITSNAMKAIELRGPYDLANLGNLFGMNSDIAKKAISMRCASVIAHGEARKTQKTVLKMISVSELMQEQFHEWKLDSEMEDSLASESIQKKENNRIEEDNDTKNDDTLLLSSTAEPLLLPVKVSTIAPNTKRKRNSLS